MTRRSRSARAHVKPSSASRPSPGTVPLPPGAFTIIGELGHIHRPRVAATRGATAGHPRAAADRLTLTLSDTLPVGNGTLRFRPSGGRPLISWDFDVETD